MRVNIIGYPDLPPLPAEHDHIEARAFAGVACAAAPAINALSSILRGGSVGAALISRPYWPWWKRLSSGATLTGAEVDAVIERVAAAKALDEERARHTDWERTCANASLF